MTDPQPLTEQPRHRATDSGWLCLVALRGSQFWEWVDNRDVDKHLAAWGIIGFLLHGTWQLRNWGTDFLDRWLAAEQSGHMIQGSEVALAVGAVLAPWATVLSVVIPLVLSNYFRARQ
jgi:hypothetical protein